MPRIVVTDLGGSLNQGKAPSELALNEYTTLQNFYQFAGKLRRRGGIHKLTASAWTERITGMLAYKPTTPPVGGVDMLVAGPTRWGIFEGSTVATIPDQAGFSVVSSVRPWTLFQYKDVAYGIREDAGLVRSDGTYRGPAGISAPVTAPTIADGAAGSIPAASFKAVYTFYNSATDMESNPSPVSNTLAHAGGLKINWTGIGISANVQVTSRRLYRSLPDQSGEYFRVAEIPNNIDTTYSEDVLAQDLGDAVSQINGEPPANLLFGDVWKERLFASDGTDLFYSADGLIEAFDPDADVPVFPDDGHKMRAIRAFGDRLVIGKTNKIHYLVGSDPSNFALLTLSDRHGCVSHHSMQVAEGNLFWLGADDVYRSDGNSVVGIASTKLQTLLTEVGDAAARKAVATVFPALNWYVLVIPGYAHLIYNYRTDVWATVSTGSLVSTRVIGDHFDDSYNQEVYLSDDEGHLYRFNDTDYGQDDYTVSGVDGSADIGATAVTRAFGGDPGTNHVVTLVGLLCPRYSEVIGLSAFLPDSEPLASDKSRTSVSLDYSPRWKIYSLSTRQQARSYHQLAIVYSGETNIDIEGFFIDIEPTGQPTMAAA